MIYGLKNVEDFMITEIPEDVDLTAVEAFATLRAEMDELAYSQLLEQYTRPPMAILLEPIKWLITDSPDEVEAFQPTHDCDSCRAGNDRARDFLIANPGRFVACGNMHYIEVWRVEEPEG